jgi:uncharacterized protein YndB with AHSA1/START domain
VRVRRARAIAAPPEAVWDIVSDPERLPGWWPGVTRVEEVGERAWTNVLTSSRGKVVRADYTLLERTPPRRMAWRHEVAESPFERILADSRTEIELEPDDGGTRVTVAMVQSPRGWARLGTFQLRAAGRRQVGAALDGLAAMLEPAERAAPGPDRGAPGDGPLGDDEASS